MNIIDQMCQNHAENIKFFMFVVIGDTESYAVEKMKARIKNANISS
jgi:hypothetical protein